MKLNIKSIRCIFIIILILILTGFLFIFMFNKININEHTFSYYNNEEELNALNENLYAAINDYDHTTDFPYIFSYRYAWGEYKPSFIIAISKDRQIYILQGFQPMYLKNHGETAGKLTPPLWAATKKLSRSEFKYITELERNAYKEYVDSGLQTFLEEHPQDWGRESELLYGEYSFVYDPSILTYYNVYSDEIDRSFELPNIKYFDDYMHNLIRDASSAQITIHTGDGSPSC